MPAPNRTTGHDRFSIAREQMSIKIGIVGTGNLARRNYIPCLAEQQDVELGYYNRTRAKAEQVAQEHPGEVFGNFDELAAWEADAIMVLTRETDRLDAANALLDARPRRLFFEKPLVARRGQQDVGEQDFVDARAMMQRAAACGCETAMVFNYRFFDQTLRAKEIIQARGFGKVVNVSGLIHYACWSHGIDLVHHFADPVVELTALQSDEIKGDRNEARDIASSFRTAGDATGNLIATSAMSWGFPLFELIFNFEGGRLHFRDLDGDLEILENGSGRHEIHTIARTSSRWDQYNASFSKATVAYVESIRARQPPPVPGLAGLRELQVEASIKRSIRERRPVDLVEELPLGL